MPPKKATNASTKGKATTDGAADGAAHNTINGVEMPPGEVTFLLQCFKHLMGDGTITINCTAVAKERGQLNPRSIGNRIANFRKAYGFPIVAGNTNGKIDKPEAGQAEAADSQEANAHEDAASDAEVAPTPAKSRKAQAKRATAGTKRKATTSRKPAANKRQKKIVKTESDVEVEQADSQGSGERQDSQDSTASASGSGTGFTPVNASATVAPGEEEFYNEA